ncbi:hypothetical protein GY45DRAFT_1317476 [Cubamyces sp. BRFM 1775]|nr:hypothetical protein GY45DRAFT_1317476 [Cubamyces sp. BRFM 1775]
MADAIRAPWILDYLINVAEEYGGDFSLVPRSEKPLKAQVIKFLTFPPRDSKEPCVIWADVSDKRHFIHAKFSLEAMRRYMESTQYAGPITSHKSAVVRLIKIRPAFSRVARRDGRTGMTEHRRIYLDVDEFELLGSSGEPIWGSPVDVAQDADIREWMLGLQQDGGGGNVLKLRKQQHASKLSETHVQPHHQTTIDSMELKVRVARKSAAHKARPSTGAMRQRPVSDKEAVRRASWKRLQTNMKLYLRPSDSVFQQLVLLCANADNNAVCRVMVPPKQHDTAQLCPPSSPERLSDVHPKPSQTPSSAQERHSSVPRTPSHWSPSIKGSPSPQRAREGDPSDTEEEVDHNELADARDVSVDKVHSKPSSHPQNLNSLVTSTGEGSSGSSGGMPPPAQRAFTIPGPALPTTSASSPPRATPPDLRSRLRDDRHEVESLPPSSFPPSTYPQPRSPMSSPRPTPATPAYPIPTVRRVPPPQFNFLRRNPDASGDGRVLVENSDTASPGSHRCSQSQSQGASQDSRLDEGGSQGRAPPQSQSNSQPQPQPQPHSQPQRPSQLRQEIEPISSGRERSASLPRQPSSRDIKHDAQELNAAEQTPEEHPDDQAQPRSQQSLSYKGDSQSQEHALPAQVDSADARMEEQPSLDDTHHQTPDVQNTAAQDGFTSLVRDERLSSPMVVDSGERENVPRLAAGTAPGWVTMKAADSSEDSPTEVDELLSDPPAVSKYAVESAKPKRTASAQRKTLPKRKQAANIATVGRRDQIDTACMDSDDEKTANMVDRYTNQIRETARARRQGSGGKPGGLHDNLPVSGETAITLHIADVCEMQDTRPIAQPKAHDPFVWVAPTFLRNHMNSKVSDKPSVKQPGETMSALRSPVPPTASRVETKVPKRRLSSPATAEQSPVKKRRLSGAALPIAASTPRAHTTDPNVRTAVSRHASRISGASTTASSRQRPSTSRPVQVSKPARPSKVTSPPPRTSTPSVQPVAHKVEDPSSRVVESAGPSNVKYVDLRTASRSSSRTSSRTSYAPERPSHPTHDPSTSAAPQRKPSVKGKNSVKSSISSARADLVPVSDLGSLGAEVRKATPRVDSSVVVLREASSSTPAIPHHVYDSSLEPTRTPGGPPLLGWHDLLDILLKTGKARHRESHPQG